ncbi:hypothetical protein M405DRAFT_342753 [Rhizopogon salebrosus TDB-379]|nr:hypothetical protein M405DRAFT_342753 [Rhizopogon salebrosus TDB-379]
MERHNNQPVSRPRPDQLLSAKAELMQSVNDLKTRNRIFGELQTVDEILDPAEEIYGGILDVTLRSKVNASLHPLSGTNNNKFSHFIFLRYVDYALFDENLF